MGSFHHVNSNLWGTDETLSSFFFTQSNAQGTVPYLGIFLTDLTMLDTAVKDRLDVSHSHLYQGEKLVTTPDMLLGVLQ